MTTIDLSGQILTELRIEYSAVLNFNGEYGVLIICPFILDAGGVTHYLTPDQDPPEAFTPMNDLLGKAISASEIGDTGSLSLTFNDGSRILIEPNPDYEAWNLSGPDGLLIVCMPGGELATWSGIAPAADSGAPEP